MTRPTKDMTKTTMTREQLLALLQGDEGLRALLETTVQEVLEAEMDEALGAGRASAPAGAGVIAAAITAGN